MSYISVDQHDRRVTELLRANNDLVERERAAKARIEMLEAKVAAQYAAILDASGREQRAWHIIATQEASARSRRRWPWLIRLLIGR